MRTVTSVHSHRRVKIADQPDRFLLYIQPLQSFGLSLGFRDYFLIWASMFCTLDTILDERTSSAVFVVPWLRLEPPQHWASIEWPMSCSTSAYAERYGHIDLLSEKAFFFRVY